MKVLALMALCSVASADTYKFDAGKTDETNPHRCGKNISNWTDQSRVTFAGSATTLSLGEKSFGVDREELTTAGSDKLISYDFDTSPTHTVAIRFDPYCADIHCRTMNAWYVVTLHPDAPRAVWNGSNTCFEEWSGTITQTRSKP